MADTQVIASAHSDTWERTNPSNALAWITKDIAYHFYEDNNGSDGYLLYTIDGGATWSRRRVDSDNANNAMGLYYERWTPGRTGETIHLMWSGGGLDDFLYFSFESDTQPAADPTPILVQTGVSFSSSANHAAGNCSLVETASGRLIAIIRGDNSAEQWLTYSDDDGATWNDMALDPYEVFGGDHAELIPGNDLSNLDDCIIIYFDDSADELTAKRLNFDTGTPTNSVIDSETLIKGTFQHNNAIWDHQAWAIDENGLAYVVAWTHHDDATADLIVATVSLATGSLVVDVKDSDILTNPGDEHGGICATFDQINGDLYVGYYNGDGDASPTPFLMNANVPAVYAVTRNPEADDPTWEVDQTYSVDTPSDRRNMWSSPAIVADKGGRWQPIFFNDDSTDLWNQKY